MKADALSIEEIKARLTIPDVWRILQLPGAPGKSCASPFRPDKKPSFSVFDDERRFRDHATGEGGTVIDFIQLALNAPLDGALKWARQQCGGAVPLGASDAGRPTGIKRNISEQSRLTPGYTVCCDGAASGASGQPPNAKAERPAAADSGNSTGIKSNISEQSRSTPGYTVCCHNAAGGGDGQMKKPKPPPKLRPGTEAELEDLSERRGFTLTTLHEAQARGLLGFAKVFGKVAWCVSDPSGRIMEARRLDGEPWEAFGKMPARKCHAFGHGKTWPVNLDAAAKLSKLALCEGGPDLLAALEIVRREGKAESVGVVAMLGAANTRFDEAALPLFRGKMVRIFCHADEAGQKAAKAWARALVDAGAGRVDAFDLCGLARLDGQPGKDVNDLLNIAPECRAQWLKFQGEVMP
ncbi:MAG: hypothetical protein JNM99_20970 [Verrucomicrobiaceae bacterium]|nr:hypothetical protein [Verrucomicrobiaceae bacterium]